jgi:hypothetical protein
VKPSVLFLCLAACSRDGAAPAPPEPAAGDWPAGTVLAVDGVPVLAAEVEPLARAIAELYPEYTRPHCLRLALTNVSLPRAAVRSCEPERREQARAACERAQATLAGDPSGTMALSGDWRALGLDLWAAARGLERGVWSAPTELIGRFALVRLDEQSGDDARSERLSLQLLEIPYGAREGETPQAAVARALDESRLTIVDRAWDEVVPEDWKYRMRGGSR